MDHWLLLLPRLLALLASLPWILPPARPISSTLCNSFSSASSSSPSSSAIANVVDQSSQRHADFDENEGDFHAEQRAAA